MNSFHNLLAIGATNRNLGKTEFICQLLQRFSGDSIVAIKIKTFYPGDRASHGKGSGFTGDYLVRKETLEDGLSDSKRFISAGAESVYYIKSRIEHLADAVLEVRAEFSESQLFIAESNSILRFYKPGGYIMIAGPDKNIYKPSSVQLMNQADMIIQSNGVNFSQSPEDIPLEIRGSEWLI